MQINLENVQAILFGGESLPLNFVTFRRVILLPVKPCGRELRLAPTKGDGSDPPRIDPRNSP